MVVNCRTNQSRVAAPLVAGPVPTILQSASAVLVQWDTSGHRHAVVVQLRAKGASALSVAEPEATILEGTCAVVINYDESRLSILRVAGFMPTTTEGTYAVEEE